MIKIWPLKSRHVVCLDGVYVRCIVVAPRVVTRLFVKVVAVKWVRCLDEGIYGK